MERRFYLDSSVWSFAVADDVPDYRAATEEFLDHVQVLGWETLISPVVLEEINRAPEFKQTRMWEIIQMIQPTFAPLDRDASDLAEAYIDAGVLSHRHRNDCLHVAIATLSRCDFLISWNFRHLANVRRSTEFIAVNQLHGYNKDLKIYNPLEVYEV